MNIILLYIIRTLSLAKHTYMYYDCAGKRVDVRKLSLIRYSDHEGERELRIWKHIKPQWRELAKHLGFKAEVILTFAERPNSLDDMMTEWIQTDTECCWRKLIEKMYDAGLKNPANDLKYALSNQTSQD